MTQPTPKKKKLTNILKMHYIKLVYRSALFLAALIAYIVYYPESSSLVYLAAHEMPFIMALIWIVLAVEMACRFFPSKLESMGCQKQFARNYRPTGTPVSEIKPMPGIRTFAVAAAWFTLNGAIGLLYYLNIIDEGILVLICLAYSICDMICILWFCPFESWFMRNRCCCTCRIYNWDFAMMCTPLIFIRSNYTGSLVLMSLIILAKWEITFRLHPERFSTQTNESLSCAMCEEKLCQHKTQLKSLWKKYGRHGG